MLSRPNLESVLAWSLVGFVPILFFVYFVIFSFHFTLASTPDIESWGKPHKERLELN